MESLMEETFDDLVERLWVQVYQAPGAANGYFTNGVRAMKGESDRALRIAENHISERSRRIDALEAELRQAGEAMTELLKEQEVPTTQAPAPTPADLRNDVGLRLEALQLSAGSSGMANTATAEHYLDFLTGERQDG